MPRGSEFPESGELVVCTVADVKNFGAFVWLDEYPTEKGREKLALRAKVTEKADEIPFASGDFREGFIHITEVAPGWIKYIRDYVREGQTGEEGWEESGYALVDKFGSLYAAFEAAVVDEKAIERIGPGAAWVRSFLEVARENITPPYVDIDGYLEIQCPRPDGARHIRDALVKVQRADRVSVKVQYIGAPRYRLLVRANDYKTAEEEIQKAAQKVIRSIEAHGGEGKFIRKE